MYGTIIDIFIPRNPEVGRGLIFVWYKHAKPEIIIGGRRGFPSLGLEVSLAWVPDCKPFC